MDNNTVYEWILPTTFAVSAREKSLQPIRPHLQALVRSGDQVLDLCCGTGPVSFWLEQWGATVTGIDYAPYMISAAKEKAAGRNSTVTFFEADIFSYDLGQARYNLICCFGNSISDFPLSDFARLVRLVFEALKPGGRFVLQYHDGSYNFIQGIAQREGIYQEAPERITFRFKEYLPNIGASVNTICNETRGEAYDRKAYIYTVPIVQLTACSLLALEQHIDVGSAHFVDIFLKESGSD